MPSLLVDRRRHVVAPYPSDSTADLLGSDHVDDHWGTIQQPEQGRGRPMRDDGAATTGQSCRKHASGSVEWPMSDREDTAEDGMEVPPGHRAGDQLFAEAKGTQLLP